MDVPGLYRLSGTAARATQAACTPGQLTWYARTTAVTDASSSTGARRQLGDALGERRAGTRLLDTAVLPLVPSHRTTAPRRSRTRGRGAGWYSLAYHFGERHAAAGSAVNTYATRPRGRPRGATLHLADRDFGKAE